MDVRWFILCILLIYSTETQAKPKRPPIWRSADIPAKIQEVETSRVTRRRSAPTLAGIPVEYITTVDDFLDIRNMKPKEYHEALIQPTVKPVKHTRTESTTKIVNTPKVPPALKIDNPIKDLVQEMPKRRMLIPRRTKRPSFRRRMEDIPQYNDYPARNPYFNDNNHLNRRSYKRPGMKPDEKMYEIPDERMDESLDERPRRMNNRLNGRLGKMPVGKTGVRPFRRMNQMPGELLGVSDGRINQMQNKRLNIPKPDERINKQLGERLRVKLDEKINKVLDGKSVKKAPHEILGETLDEIANEQPNDIPNEMLYEIPDERPDFDAFQRLRKRNKRNETRRSMKNNPDYEYPEPNFEEIQETRNENLNPLVVVEPKHLKKVPSFLEFKEKRIKEEKDLDQWARRQLNLDVNNTQVEPKIHRLRPSRRSGGVFKGSLEKIYEDIPELYNRYHDSLRRMNYVRSPKIEKKDELANKTFPFVTFAGRWYTETPNNINLDPAAKLHQEKMQDYFEFGTRNTTDVSVLKSKEQDRHIEFFNDYLDLKLMGGDRRDGTLKAINDLKKSIENPQLKRQ
ncbi:uncharacterized protein LOC142984838 [Anticarsia gemmatalis]|uniref:uncharacterized protein LOC142984838 n=1 Tax=Anticarsia gemmatalis TaxID=129554 RepID=UPI003F76D367